MLSLIDQATDYQSRVEAAMAKAYEALEEAVFDMGQLKVHTLAGAVNMATDITVSTRRVMGITLPVIQTRFTEHPPYYSPMGTSFRIDSALQYFKEALLLLGRLSELKISVLRLANEVKKTIRKVNALEKIAIPSLEDTVHYIDSRLEENERDMFVLMKMVKRNLEKKTLPVREFDHE